MPWPPNSAWGWTHPRYIPLDPVTPQVGAATPAQDIDLETLHHELTEVLNRLESGDTRGGIANLQRIADTIYGKLR